MKVLLTGGTGYVGSHLRESLREAGHEVRLLVRRESAGKVPASQGYDVVHGDVFETNTCLNACAGVDAVVHLIGIIREIPSRGITFDELHRVATRNLVDAARRSGVDRFVYMSALGARADSPAAYLRSKAAAEKLVREAPFRSTVFRPSFLFGHGDDLTRMVTDLLNKPVVPMIDGGRTLFQPVALEDVCTVFTRALRLPETQGRTYELGGPDRVSFREIVTKTASCLGRSVRTISVPGWMMAPVVALIERWPWAPLTTDQLKMLRENNICEIDPYVKTFQVEPKSYLEALPSLVEQRPERPAQRLQQLAG